MKRLVVCVASLLAVACGGVAHEEDVTSDTQSRTESDESSLVLFANNYGLSQASSTRRNADGTVTVTLQLSTYWTGFLKSASTTVEVYQLPNEENARSSYLDAAGAFTLPASARVYSTTVSFNTLEDDRFNTVVLTLPGSGHLVAVVGRASIASDSTPTNNIRTLTRLSTRTGGDF